VDHLTPVVPPALWRCALETRSPVKPKAAGGGRSIVGRRSDLRGGGAPYPFIQKSGTPQPFQKYSYKVGKTTKICEKCQNWTKSAEST
jgi:hypothetical protein